MFSMGASLETCQIALYCTQKRERLGILFKKIKMLGMLRQGMNKKRLAVEEIRAGMQEGSGCLRTRSEFFGVLVIPHEKMRE